MDKLTIQTTVEQDGVLRLGGLPYRRGERVEATLSRVTGSSPEQRASARERLLQLFRSSTLRSAGPYPTRDQLHERH